jgi:hypothetical protein
MRVSILCLLATLACGQVNGSSDLPDATATVPIGDEPSLQIDRPEFDFGTVVVDTETAPITVTVTNIGDVPTTALTEAKLDGPGKAMLRLTDGCAGIVLAANASCTVDVVLLASSTGTLTASISIGILGGAEVSSSLVGTIVVPGNLTLAASTEFGPRLVGATVSRLITVTNAGGVASGAIEISLAGNDASQFTLEGGTCRAGQAIAAGANCTVGVRFVPTTRGAKTAQLVVDASPGGPGIGALAAIGQETFTLTVNKVGAGGGTITSAPAGIDCDGPGSDCSETFTVGTVAPTVTLSVTPSAGARFDRFTGACTSTNPDGCTVQMSASRTVTASFTPEPVGIVNWTLNGNFGTGPTVTVAPTSSIVNVTGVALSTSPALGSGPAFTNIVAPIDWSTGANDLTKFFEFGATASAGHSVIYDRLEFSIAAPNTSAAGSSSWEVRSNADNFATVVASGTVDAVAGAGTKVVASLPGVGQRTGTVMFRVYIFNNVGGGTAKFRGFRGVNSGGGGLVIFGAPI